MEPVVSINHLTKYYGKHLAVDDISFSVKAGDFYAFIGPNGAGKSTTIRVLLGLINKTSGSAKIFGQEVGPSPTDLLQRIGYVPSESHFYPGMTAAETIALAAKTYQSVDPKESQRLTDLFQVDLHKKVETLSFGNRRKLSLVMALQHRPELIILDEPTSGLDPLVQQNFWQELLERNKAGVTILTSSHNLNEIQKYCKKQAFINQGKLIQEGSMQDLIQSHAKRINVHGLTVLPKLEGEIKDLRIDGDSIDFLYQGDVAHVLKVFGEFADQIDDINISNPDLEEVFLHFYKTD